MCLDSLVDIIMALLTVQPATCVNFNVPLWEINTVYTNKRSVKSFKKEISCCFFYYICQHF